MKKFMFRLSRTIVSLMKIWGIGSDKLLTKEEVEELIHSYSPEIKVIHGLSSHYNSLLKLISIWEEDRRLFIILHELGHHFNCMAKGTANHSIYRIVNLNIHRRKLVKSKIRVTKTLRLKAEKEAWDWAKNEMKTIGIMDAIQMAASYNTYKYNNKN